MKRLELFVLALIIFIALAVRLYKIERPLADWHSWRQADTAAVSRNFVKDGYNPFIPKFDDMSTQANGLDNPNRYRFVEFPIYNSLLYFVWLFTGVSTTAARLTTVSITLVSTLFLYLIVRKFSGWQTASLAAFFFATVPYNVFYSSTILPGPFMVMSVLGLYFFFTRFLQRSNLLNLALIIIFANLTILSWPIAAFFFIPVLYLALEKYKLGILKQPKLWIFTLASLLPFAAWRIWILNFPEGIPNFQFLINEGNIRFKGAFFRWLIAERLGKLILTVPGFAIFILGLVKKTGSEKYFYLSILVSVGIYFSVFASGNVRHDYYQVPAIPALAIFMAIGTKALFDFKSNFINPRVGPAAAIVLISLIYAFGFFEVQGYYWINRPQIIEAGEAVDKLLPRDATVVAPYNGDAAFLYATNRRGYPITDRALSKYVEQGTKYLVSVETGDAGIQNLAANCKVLEQTTSYVIIELSNDCV